MRVLIPLIALMLIGTLAFGVARSRRRRRSEVPELNKHPERLEEELDASDDA